MTTYLAGKVAVVTGASAGVGRAITRALGQQGARVGLIARGPDGLEAAAREIRASGGEALVLALDVEEQHPGHGSSPPRGEHAAVSGCP